MEWLVDPLPCSTEVDSPLLVGPARREAKHVVVLNGPIAFDRRSSLYNSLHSLRWGSKNQAGIVHIDIESFTIEHSKTLRRTNAPERNFPLEE